MNGDALSSAYATRVRENPQDVARRAIRLLEARIHQEFGLRVVMGAELEFAALPRAGESKAIFFSLPEKNGGTYFYEASAARPPAQQDGFFPQSRYVNRVYRETTSPCPWQQLEVVFTHRPGDHERHLPADSLMLIRSIEAMKKHLQTERSGHKNLPDWRGRALQGYWADLRARTDEIRFNASIPGSNIHNGLHLNMSLTDAEGHEPIAQQPDIAKRIQNGLGYMFEENLYLLGSTQQALTRLRDRHPSHVVKFSQQIKKHPDYLETRLPAADSNPSYAVLLQLAGTYSALLHTQGETAGIDPQTYQFDALSAETLHKEFEHGTLLKDTLNRVEPELGDRFCEAIRLTPPGKEQPQASVGR